MDNLFSSIGSVGSSLVALGSSVASPLMQGGFSLVQQDKQHAHDRRMQERQWMLNRYDTIDERKYNTYMANTAYQRTVNDLRKAGLNPILMFGGASPQHYVGNSARSVSAPSTTAGGGISSFDIIGALGKFQGFQSARDLQKFNRENHEVNLATKEADLAIRQLEALSIYSDIKDKQVNTALKTIDYDRRSRSWYQTFEDYRDISNTISPHSKIGGIVHDASNAIFGSAAMIKSAMEKPAHTAIDIHDHGYRMGLPETGYKYRYFKGFRKRK